LTIRRDIWTFILLCSAGVALGESMPDTTRYDRAVQGRPFDLQEILGDAFQAPGVTESRTPDWVLKGELSSDTLYYGIGHSRESQEAADNNARLAFAQHVEVSVSSIARQQIAENRDRLDENYTYESLVTTNMSLRSVKITQRHVTRDSTFFSLISYGKSTYHRLVTQEIQVSLEANIRKQELAHQAREALRADSLRHKITMDSLTLARKQAVIDSLARILEMDQARLKQEQERIDLIKSRHTAFLRIKPRYTLIDVPTASTPNTWVYAAGRWSPETSQLRQLNVGISAWLLSAEANLWASNEIVDQVEALVKLQILPEQGEIYKVSLALGMVDYIAAFSPMNRLRLREENPGNSLIEIIEDELTDPYAHHSSFFLTGSVGLPEMNNHLSVYLDKRRLSLANIWYPFPRNLGDAISVINQVDYIRSKFYRNRFDDPLQWQVGLRLIAIPDRFATMISYEDHEVWMLNFEFQY